MNVEDVDLRIHQHLTCFVLLVPVLTHIVGLQLPQRFSDGHVHTLFGVPTEVRHLIFTILVASKAPSSACFLCQDGGLTR